MEACTEDLSKYAEAAAKRDALEEKLKALQAEYEAAKKDVENIEQERASNKKGRQRSASVSGQKLTALSKLLRKGTPGCCGT